ncbi:MAG: prolyl oligopeptidase family serine peptidase [Bryobacteraceae bacterium]|nr:prolyl oligopeptidase family serine peptidase [Bryobacteraceae bacterium]
MWLPLLFFALAPEKFTVVERPAFLIPAPVPGAGKPWVWYAPNLPQYPGPEERWMFERFAAAGIAVAGIDAGESYGSPAGNAVFTALYEHLVARGYSTQPILLGRSRGGLMLLSWAASHPQQVAAFAGIYPVTNLESYPGLAKAATAYQLTAEALKERLKEFNPVDRLDAIAAARVPLFALHGDQDRLVPLEANSGLLKARYRGPMQLVVCPGQGHNMWKGFFESQELVDFVLAHVRP